jgi:hypothetical protein
MKPQVDTVSGLRTRIKAGGTRDPGLGYLMSDLNLEVKDDAQMDKLGKATDDIMAAKMEILAGGVDSNSGEETTGGVGGRRLLRRQMDSQPESP